MNRESGLKAQNISGFVIGALLLGVTLGGINLWGEIERQKRLAEPPSAGEILYLPSPLEAELLSPEYGLWPRLFSARTPPLPERAPEIYGGFSFAPKAFPKISPEDLDRARRWSVALNAGDLATLERTLPQQPDPAEQLAKRALQSCSLMEQEALYRWSQLRPSLRDPFVAYLDNCDAKSVVHDWLMLQQGLSSKSRRLADRAVAKMKLRSFSPIETWSSWFATKAVRYAEFTLNPPSPENN